MKNIIRQTRYWLLVTVIAQFTAKNANLGKAIYFLSLMSCSINKSSPFFKFLYFPILRGKNILLQEMLGGGKKDCKTREAFAE